MKPRLEKLESLRALACISVFLFHSYIFRQGYWCINVFITLSAFLMTYNGLGREDRFPTGFKGCALYAWGKTKRLYPLYFITLLILIVRIVILAPENPPVEQLIIFAKQFVLCALLIQSWPPNTVWSFSFNVVGWYISTSLLLYFCFPFILRRISRLKSRRSALVMIFVIYGLMLLSGFAAASIHSRFVSDPEAQGNFQQWFTYVFPVFRLGDFSIGCLAGYIFSVSDFSRLRPSKATLMELAAILFFFGTHILYRMGSLPKFMIFNLLFILPVAALVFTFAIGKGAVSSLLDKRPTRLIADYSAEIFLLHDVAILYASPLSNFLPLPYILQQAVFVVFVFGVTAVSCVIWRRISRRFPALALR